MSDSSQGWHKGDLLWFNAYQNEGIVLCLSPLSHLKYRQGAELQLSLPSIPV
jgi:hypothetical protein